MKKNLLSVTLALLLLAVFSASASATNSEDDETVSAGTFLFRFNRDKTALSLWYCERAEATMTLPDKVYYDSETKTADLKPFGKAKAYAVEQVAERTFRGKTEIQSITLPASYRNVESTAFMNCTNLKTFVSLGKDVIYEKSVFAGCKSLENVTINAESIGAHIFNGCERLVNPHITGKLDHIPDAAFEESGIKNINFLPKSITAIWASAFSKSKLEGDLVLPTRFSIIENGAFSLTNIKSVTIPEGYTELRGGLFAGCKSLTKVSLPKSLKCISGMAFSNTDIKQIYIPNSVTDLGPSAFYNCFNLDSVHLSNSLEKLEGATFHNTALKHIYLPASIKQIERNCFELCRQLTDIYCFSSTPPEAHEYTFTDYDKPTIHVPAGKLAAYKNAPVWKKFKKFKEMSAAATDIPTTRSEVLSIYRTGNEVHVSGVPTGTLVQVYTLNGQLIAETISNNSETVLSVNTTYPIIVKAGKQTVKLK